MAAVFRRLAFPPAEGYGKRHIHVSYKKTEANMTVYLYIIMIPLLLKSFCQTLPQLCTEGPRRRPSELVSN